MEVVLEKMLQEREIIEQGDYLYSAYSGGPKAPHQKVNAIAQQARVLSALPYSWLYTGHQIFPAERAKSTDYLGTGKPVTRGYRRGGAEVHESRWQIALLQQSVFDAPRRARCRLHRSR
jgi:hypothetical protein